MTLTRQQLQGGASYSPKTLAGNWFEDRLLLHEKRKEFQAKKLSGNLSILRTKELFDSALNTVAIDSFHELQTFNEKSQYPAIHSGVQIALVNCKLETSGLSVCPALHESEFRVAAAPLLRPVARSVFVIEDVQGTKGTPILYGQHVRLRLPQPLAPLPDFYLKCDSEMIQTRMVSQRAQRVFCGSGADASSLWKICYPNVNERFEREGTIVAAESPFVLQHVQSHQPLSVIERNIYSIFGREDEVGCQILASNSRHVFCESKSGSWLGEGDCKQERGENIWRAAFTEWFQGCSDKQ